jgi:hypothetical protein
MHLGAAPAGTRAAKRGSRARKTVAAAIRAAVELGLSSRIARDHENIFT